MYQTLFIVKDDKLSRGLERLHVWGTDFEAPKRVRDGHSGYQEIKKRRYDLVILEIAPPDIDGLRLLRRIKSERLCQHVVLCGETPSFEYARQGMIYGAYDYLVFPFEERVLYALMNRIKGENYVSLTMEIAYSDEVLELFREHSSQIYTIFPKIVDRIYAASGEGEKAEGMIRTVYEQIIEGIYGENSWLGLYQERQEVYGLPDLPQGEAQKAEYSRQIIALFDLYHRLFPPIASKGIKEVVLYILNNPESDVKEKHMAERLFMNPSFFSAAFLANTGQRFVEYLLSVRLQRAAYLLKNSTLKIAEISLRLSYKDTGYFSRLFKKKFGVTPSEYREAERL